MPLSESNFIMIRLASLPRAYSRSRCHCLVESVNLGKVDWFRCNVWGGASKNDPYLLYLSTCLNN